MAKYEYLVDWLRDHHPEAFADLDNDAEPDEVIGRAFDTATKLYNEGRLPEEAQQLTVMVPKTWPAWLIKEKLTRITRRN